jgi:hypothetical protein
MIDDDSMDDDSTDSLESAIGGVETAVEQVESAVGRVEMAVARVEAAVKNKWSTAQLVIAMFIGVFLWSLPGTIWHAKWRYAATYNISSSEVYVQDKPHDCAFLAAPLGEKYCHYERTVSITRWATSQTGNPIVSNDDGKTWSSFDPAGEKVPQYSTVKAVYIGWEKKED